jgi:DNA ligase-associated metallophosphoesterase
VSVPLKIGGLEAELHAPGFLWLSASRLLCAADLHLEKGSFFHRFGSFLPPYDTQETLKLLERGLKQFAPQRFVALGDSFHDVRGAARLGREDKDHLNTLIERVPEWLWVTGNHDPSIDAEIRGLRRACFLQDGVVFRHITEVGEQAEISGHYHPKTTVRARGQRITTACFVQRGERLILPALGVFTGGLDIDSREFRVVMPQDGRHVFTVHHQQVYPLYAHRPSTSGE